MSLDRTVLAFAGVMILLSVLLTAFVSPLFCLVHGLHRREPAAIGLYRRLPGGLAVQQNGRKARHGVLKG